MDDAAQIEKELEYQWNNFRAEPKYVQMQLSALRDLESKRDDATDYVKAFLVATSDLPGTAIAVLTPGSVTILVDDDGNLLEFA